MLFCNISINYEFKIAWVAKYKVKRTIKNFVDQKIKKQRKGYQFDGKIFILYRKLLLAKYKKILQVKQ